MSDTGLIYPTTAATAAEAPYSTIDWVNPTNITACDGSSATCTGASRSYVLYAKSFNFAALPDGATIDGVEFSILWQCGGGVSMCSLIQLTRYRRSSYWS